MLLLMLQQSASNMGNMVYDQFLSRHSNQVCVGIVVGSVILTVIQHAAVSDSFNPILGASLVLLVVFLTLVMLVYFLYSAMLELAETLAARGCAATAARLYGARQRRLDQTR